MALHIGQTFMCLLEEKSAGKRWCSLLNVVPGLVMSCWEHFLIELNLKCPDWYFISHTWNVNQISLYKISESVTLKFAGVTGLYRM